MPRKRHESIDASHLLNFSCGIPSDLPSTSHTPQARRAHKKNYKKLEAERKERSVRDKLSSSFFLQASSSHAFIISRDQKEKQIRPQKKEGNRPDKKVQWDIVRVVKCLIPSTGSVADLDSSLTTCSICLDNFVAPRIAPCGHLFCYPCILRHLDSSSTDASTKSLMGKCPCCYHLMSQQELRPVEFTTYQSPLKASTMEFRKLYRCKSASAPFIPSSHTKSVDQSAQKETLKIQKRVSSSDFPSSSQEDSCFSRFNYLDTASYQEHFINDIVSLEREVDNISAMYAAISGSNASSCENDKSFVFLAIQAVKNELAAAELIISKEDEHKTDVIMSEKKNIIEVLPFEKSIASSRHDGDLEEEGKEEDRDGAIHETKSSQKKTTQKKIQKGFKPGTMYMTNDMVQYYQAIDGQLCFLSGFNLNCLSNEFSAKDPIFTAFSESQRGSDEIETDKKIEMKPPFPDIVKGQIIDMEQLHITPEVLKRMPCFSHIPLYSDITMVEIDINGLLSHETRERFKKDMKKRRERRQAKKDAEKKAEREAQLKEEARIGELKRGVQRIDPDDPFFKMSMNESDTSSQNVFNAGDFTNSLQAEETISSASISQTRSRPGIRNQPMSFSSACVERDAFPSLNSSNASSFPSLAAASSLQTKSKKTASGSAWGSHKVPQASAPRGKKNKGKKIVLFSTGGRRGHS